MSLLTHKQAGSAGMGDLQEGQGFLKTVAPESGAGLFAQELSH